MRPMLGISVGLAVVLTASAAGAWWFVAGGPVMQSPVGTSKAKLQADHFHYADWDEVLSRFVDDAGRVNYRALKKDRAALDRFVALLGAAGPTTKPAWFTSKPAQLAYYINAYNALTLFSVVNQYPELKSVHDEKVSFFVRTRFLLDGSPISLYDLENKIVRPRFAEPRAHFALNCASAGCPVLPNEKFDPAKLEGQLERETKAFLDRPENLSVVDGEVVLSSIFKWYAADFGDDPLAWVRQRRPQVPDDPTPEHRDYDWSLNDQAGHDQATKRPAPKDTTRTTPGG
jgi:hypothetical protein